MRPGPTARRSGFRTVLAAVCTCATACSSGDGSSDHASSLAVGSLSAESFNPSLGEEVQFSYAVSAQDTVTVLVFDWDGGLIQTLVEDVAQGPGMYRVAWDGRDLEGRVVPDEAYFFTVERASGEVFDPTTFSGGVVGDITRARFQPDGTVMYSLPAAARVLIRLGIQSGPMLRTLVDWKPRVAGAVTEYWDGRDEDRLIKLRDHEDFRVLITYVTLAEATVISYGNTEESYREYKLGRGKDQPSKPDRPRRADPGLRLRPEHLVPPAWARAPKVQMSFPEHGNTPVPSAQEAITVRIEVDSSDRQLLLSDQFELIFYVDNIFFAEAERGYLPFNWLWELNQIPPGEHILTVNVSSFKGHVGVSSRKVRVVKAVEDR